MLDIWHPAYLVDGGIVFSKECTRYYSRSALANRTIYLGRGIRVHSHQLLALSSSVIVILCLELL